MSEILDEPFEEKNKKSKVLEHHTRQAYSRLLTSIALAIVGIFIFIIGILFNDVIDISVIINFVFIIPIFLSFSYSLSGLANAVMSFYKNEENNFKKWISLFGNILFPLFLVAFLLIFNF